MFKAGVAYLALGWIVTQVSSTVAPLLNLPDWIGAVVLWIGVLAFPFVIMFSWIYEITPEGQPREKRWLKSRPSRQSASGRTATAQDDRCFDPTQSHFGLFRHFDGIIYSMAR